MKLLKFKNLMDLLEAFPTEQACIQYLINVRHSGKIACPHQDCKCEKVYAFKDGKTFKCAECKKRFSVRVGSIFQDSNIPLKKWFMAIYLITNHKKWYFFGSTFKRHWRYTEIRLVYASQITPRKQNKFF